MKQITRNLFVYQADIHASVATIKERLPAFAECGEHQAASHGFVEVLPQSGEIVQTVPGGWAINFREDTRQVPASVVLKTVEEDCAHFKASFGRNPSKNERKKLREEAAHALLPRAFVRSKATCVLYSADKERLYIATSSQKTADRIVTQLVLALEAIKTSTVHVSAPKQGLTARLKTYIEVHDEEAFGNFRPEGDVVLAGLAGKWSVKADTIWRAKNTLLEAISKGTQVDSIGFTDADGIAFRVTKELRIKGVKHRTVDADDDTSLDHQWVTQAASEIVSLDNIVNELLDLLSPEKAQGMDGGGGLFCPTQKCPNAS